MEITSSHTAEKIKNEKNSSAPTHKDMHTNENQILKVIVRLSAKKQIIKSNKTITNHTLIFTRMKNPDLQHATEVPPWTIVIAYPS